ncbi:DUF5666 domain-containing protein [Nocardia aurantiaca]|uniref:DUF5666 domain-containing protein n=1 Tax=Nocardia aurantiaca TaxID=2675850 RepID=A0A6I3L2H9_9NOCA|nr:DUF5666 domain-containing protein [Nocardia aurantiaca]MTE14824.1 hypothetical protein [Nocardia aurantiaca]
MTNPSDPWSRRPEPDPGERPAEQATPDRHTSDSAAGYGPTQAIPSGPTDYFGQPPGLDATRVLPPVDAQWGGYETGGGYEPTAVYPGQQGYSPTSSYGAPGYPAAGAAAGGPGYPGGPGVPPGGYQPAGFPQNPPPPEPPRRTTLWIALGIAAVIVVAIVAVLVGTVLSDKVSSNSASAPSGSVKTSAYPQPSLGNTSAVPLPSGIPTIPGLGDLDQLGGAMGTIAGNDGSTLTITSLSGGTVTVKTDDKTQVISLGSTKVSDLPVGEVVMVQGDKNADGSIQAKLIFSTSMPSGTR